MAVRVFRGAVQSAVDDAHAMSPSMPASMPASMSAVLECDILSPDGNLNSLCPATPGHISALLKQAARQGDMVEVPRPGPRIDVASALPGVVHPLAHVGMTRTRTDIPRGSFRGPTSVGWDLQ